MAVSKSSSSFLKWLLDPKKNFLAAMHKSALDKRLRKYGLRFDDLYDPMEDLDIKEALNRLPREIVDARNQRLKRAIDLSMKHEYLPEDLQLRNSPDDDALDVWIIPYIPGLVTGNGEIIWSLGGKWLVNPKLNDPLVKSAMVVNSEGSVRKKDVEEEEESGN
ncbi:hypothetical protein Cgig2_028054 [Carnegiea gigantea]|uniref:Complex III subunit VII n=1 Tax=Carnegiea gigantea TaxID=171969 RepID=A0A9Q1Q5X7_9CARY|nr:hypothetical protein Cgig2_028054 [Carnegiea gigantea]